MGFIYVFTDPDKANLAGGGGKWKVGLTNRSDVFERVKDFKTSFPDGYLCFCYEVSNPSLTEKYLHSNLEQKYERRGEWFTAPNIDVLLGDIVRLLGLSSETGSVNSDHVVGTSQIAETPTLQFSVVPADQITRFQTLSDGFCLDLPNLPEWTLYQICDSLYSGWYYDYESHKLVNNKPEGLSESKIIDKLLIPYSRNYFGDDAYLSKYRSALLKAIDRAKTLPNVYIDLNRTWFCNFQTILTPIYVKVTNHDELRRFCVKKYRLYSLNRIDLKWVLELLGDSSLLYEHVPLNTGEHNTFGEDFSNMLHTELEEVDTLLSPYNLSIYFMGTRMFVDFNNKSYPVYTLTLDVRNSDDTYAMMIDTTAVDQLNYVPIGILDAIDKFCRFPQSGRTQTKLGADALKTIANRYGVQYTRIADKRVFDDIVAKHGQHRNPFGKFDSDEQIPI